MVPLISYLHLRMNLLALALCDAYDRMNYSSLAVHELVRVPGSGTHLSDRNSAFSSLETGGFHGDPL